MSQRLVPAALVASLLLSGCLGALDGAPDGSAPPTTEQVDPSDASLPPGVSESGVENATALADAHEQALRTEGFVLNGTFVRERANTNQTRHYNMVVAPEAATFRANQRSVLYRGEGDERAVARRTRTQLWGDESGIRMRVTLGDRDPRVTTVDEVPPELALTRAPQYRSYLRIGAYDVERVVRRGDHTYTTLVADSTSADFDGDATIDARLVVDERGVVHEASVTLTTDRGTDRATYRVRELGGSPDRPAWASD
jgi:hypothetical protein